MGETEGFDDWIQDVSPDSFEGGGFIAPGWMAWLRETYNDGPPSREELDVRAAQAIEDLVATAPWSRIIEDVRATTGRALDLRLSAQRSDSAQFDVEVVIDGRRVGSFGRAFPAPEPEAVVADLADHLRGFALDEELWGGWPICPAHGTHPLDAVLDGDGTAIWRCPEGTVAARIGRLASTMR